VRRASTVDAHVISVPQILLAQPLTRRLKKGRVSGSGH
jgi:hypothetical protein